MAEETPVAAVPTTEATPNETQPVEPVAPQPAQPYFTPEQLSEMEKFVTANGGFDTAWAKMKGNVSNPQHTTQPEALQATQTPQPAHQPSEQPNPAQTPSGEPTQPQPAAGTYSMEEMAALTYFDRLADMEQYANIADDIRSGKVLEGLKSFNISPISDGRINDAGVRKYLDLYAASKPAVPTSATPSADTQVDYLPIKEVKTMDDATKIQLQNIQLRAEGKPLHPATQAANDFVKAFYAEGRDKK